MKIKTIRNHPNVDADFDIKSITVTLNVGTVLNIDPKNTTDHPKSDYKKARKFLQSGAIVLNQDNKFVVAKPISDLPVSSAWVLVSAKTGGYSNWIVDDPRFPEYSGKSLQSFSPKATVLTSISSQILPTKSAAPSKPRTLIQIQKHPCCQVPPGPNDNFLESIQHDATRFSHFVGGAAVGIQGPAFSKYLTSALHLEMKLWKTTKLSQKYLKNHARHNSWQTMQQRSPNTFGGQGYDHLFDKIDHGFPSRNSCAILDYDYWVLKTINELNLKGKEATFAILPSKTNTPTTLASIGHAQKVLNIYVKYHFCWQRVGKSNGIKLVPPHCFPINPNGFMCALHAPIDAIMLSEFIKLPLGADLKSKKLVNQSNPTKKQSNPTPYIKQSLDGQLRPWSKLHCLRTYYGFQLIFRRVAMRTWQNGCGCSDAQNLTNRCAEMFEKEFPKEIECQGPDWIQAACDLPDEVIDATLKQLEENERVEKILKDDISNQEDLKSAGEILAI